MNKLTKAQRDKLTGIGIGTVALMALIYFFVITSQQKQLAAINKSIGSMKTKIGEASRVVRGSLDVGLSLTNSMNKLQAREAGLPPDHDPYAWMLDSIGKFIINRNGVNIREMSREEVSEKGIIPHFPYKWATFHIHAVGYYHEFGKFIADFENAYPYFIIMNLEVAPAGTTESQEKLGYTFDLVAPIVPAADTK